MARIRTIKPEFWESETVATLSLPARLTFIACLNLADDEGLLRWHPAHVKAFAFPYDDDLLTERVSEWMDELVTAGLIYPYQGAVKSGQKQAQYGWIIGFHEHQKINRPSPSKYPPPSLQSSEVRRLYGERDGWVCQISGEPIEARSSRYRGDPQSLSLDHIIPKSQGGSDYPSNIRATTQSANKGRRDRDDLSDSVSGSVNESTPEGKGREGKGEEGSAEGRGNGSRPLSDETYFEDWWQHYPRKQAKGRARKAYRSARKKTDHDTLVDAVQKYSAAVAETDKQFIKLPATWLNDEAWLDEPTKPEQRKPWHDAL